MNTRFDIFGKRIDLDVAKVVAKMTTHRFVARTIDKETGKTATTLAILGTSKDKAGKRKLFFRTGLLEGFRLSVGRIRREGKRV